MEITIIKCSYKSIIDSMSMTFSHGVRGWDFGPGVLPRYLRLELRHAAVLETQGSCLTNKYSEGYPGAR